MENFAKISYRNQSIDLLFKLMDWFLYDRDFCHERVKGFLRNLPAKKYKSKNLRKMQSE